MFVDVDVGHLGRAVVETLTNVFDVFALLKHAARSEPPEAV